MRPQRGKRNSTRAHRATSGRARLEPRLGGSGALNYDACSSQSLGGGEKPHVKPAFYARTCWDVMIRNEAGKNMAPTWSPFPVISGSQGVHTALPSPTPRTGCPPDPRTWALLLLVGEQVIQGVFGDVTLLLLGGKTGRASGKEARGSPDVSGWVGVDSAPCCPSSLPGPPAQ